MNIQIKNKQNVLLILTLILFVMIIVVNIELAKNLSDIVRTPGAAALVVAIFGYLTIDRLRDMSSRIEKSDERSLSLWQSITKDSQEVAAKKAEKTVKDMQTEIERHVAELTKRIKETIDSNPWLKSLGPNDLVNIKHLEPIHHCADQLIQKEETETARKLILDAITDPEVIGTPTAYHNLGVLASRDLKDDLLAMKIYDKYLEKNPEPSPDVIADALEVATDAGDQKKAEDLAKRIVTKLDANDATYVQAWRTWVFLSSYYASLGDNEKSISILSKASTVVKDPRSLGHVLRNLASRHISNGDVSKSEEIYKQCLAIMPTNIPTILEYTHLLWQSGRTDEAIQLAKSAISKGNLDLAWDKHFKRLQEILNKLSNNNGAQKEHDLVLLGVNTALKIAKNILDQETMTKLVSLVEAHINSAMSASNSANKPA